MPTLLVPDSAAVERPAKRSRAGSTPRLRALAALILAGFAGCSDDAPADLEEAGEAVVYTTFHPTTYFSRRIAGDRVPVVCPLPPGQDPATWRPDRSTVERFQHASVIVFNGAEYERWMRQASLPGSRVVQCAEAVEELIFREEVSHSHGDGPAHTHAAVDGTVWMDPLLAIVEAKAIHDALARRFPEHAAEFEDHLNTLSDELRVLSNRWRELSASLSETPLVSAHSSYAYLARRHGWKLTELDLDPEMVPDEGQLAALDEARGEAAFGLLLWPDPPREEVAAAYAERSFRSVHVDTLERETEGNYATRTEANVDRLHRALAAD